MEITNLDYIENTNLSHSDLMCECGTETSIIHVSVWQGGKGLFYCECPNCGKETNVSWKKCNLDTSKPIKPYQVAFNYIKEIFPSLSIVIYSKDLKWCYMDEDFNALNFEGKNIDVSILEAAADNIEHTPFIYQPNI